MGFSPQDAMVLGSVLRDLDNCPPERKKCFVNKNKKDFGLPAIVDPLREGLQIHFKFSGCFGVFAERDPRGLGIERQRRSHGRDAHATWGVMRRSGLVF